MNYAKPESEYGQYVEVNGQSCLGSHYIGEVFGGIGMNDPNFIEITLRRCAYAAGATVLQSNFHHFPSGGVTGIVVLSESHISIHSWPEHDYAAVDIFMCGHAKIKEAIRVLEADFMPKRLVGTTMLRGHDIPDRSFADAGDALECRPD
ncbi:adenosylmethionine decarboxylase [Mycobacterium sp. KBS0706]|uniref:adenosylmethionine decarboxylase n=1 Tax=Mycobacterium sp. KBS0706 TaxID=2578109 RepID=UPI00163DA044|nr:adenosylmethionine decarboxylase [Mycobacterium sp. KBS0706]